MPTRRGFGFPAAPALKGAARRAWARDATDAVADDIAAWAERFEEALFEVIVASPERAKAPRERTRWNPFGLAARLLPGGPKCSVVWGAL